MPSLAEPDDVQELRRRAVIAGATLLGVHLLYTVFQIVSLLLSWHPPFIDVGVLWFSVAVNLALDVVAIAYVVLIRLAGRRPRADRWIHGVTVAFCLLVIFVWGIQLHIGGSQSSHMLAVVLSTLLVFAWVLPPRSLLVVTVITTAWLLAVVGLEITGVLQYSPLLPAVQGVRDVFLDWRVLTMNAAIFVCTITVSMGAVLAMRRVAMRSREALRRGNLQLRQEAEERERAQNTLRLAVEELSGANEGLRRILQAATHDLRSPMTVIDGYANLLKEEMEDPAGSLARDHLQQLEKGAQYMRRLLDDLSRLVLQDDRSVAPVPCDAARIVDGVVAMFELQARELGARIEVGLLPVVLAEEVRLARVFQNLVGNALKFRSGDAPWVGIDAEPAGEDWCFRVQDNGIGIPVDQAERVFEPFVRLASGSREEGGNGIGLSVCRKAIEALGGRIWAEPRAGGGSIFRFSLRRASTSPPRRSPGSEQCPDGPHSRGRSGAGRTSSRA